jgi:hypothetical protein
MASTRNNNTRGNYQLEQMTYKENERYNLYKHSSYGEACHNHLAGIGLIQGHLPRNQVSYNSVNTESFLFGINSTNLVHPESPFVAEPRHLQPMNLYQPNPVIMPQPLVIERNRPFPCP